MHLKALTAILLIAVFSVSVLHPTHVKALGQPTTKTTNSGSSSNSTPSPSTNVTVAAGDSLSTIATTYSTTYVRIFDANAQIQDPDLIYPGEEIRIPAANEQLPDRLASTTATSAPIATTTSASALAQVSAAPAVSANSSSVWTELAACESGGNWSINTGNGYYGGLQFTLSSWAAVGGSGYPNQASESEQIARAQILESRQGWGAWPVCSAKIGL